MFSQAGAVKLIDKKCLAYDLKTFGGNAEKQSPCEMPETRLDENDTGSGHASLYAAPGPTQARGSDVYGMGGVPACWRGGEYLHTVAGHPYRVLELAR